MRKMIFFFISLWVLSACDHIVESTIQLDCTLGADMLDHPDGQDFQSILDAHVALGLPGISLQIISPEGTWTGASGMADIEEGIPFTPCHVSKTGSITKLMMASLTMKLVEEGLMDLNDPISDYIDASILDKINMRPDVRIRNLMNHTTAIYDVITSSDFYLAVINNPSGSWDQKELLEFVYGQDAYELNEGTPAIYSNTNTLLLSLCIEEATGKEHGALLREKVLDPLSMSDTYYVGYESAPETTAQGYFDLHNNNQLFNVSNFNTGNGNGYVGIYSTVFDLNRFIQALFVDGSLLAPSSVDSMLTELVPMWDDGAGDMTKVGLGLFKKYYLLDYQGIGHEGGDLGYAANMFYFPDNETLISYLLNYGTNGTSDLREVYEAFDKEIMARLQE